MSRSVWIKRVVCIIIALALIFIGYFYKKDTDNIPTDFYIGVIRTTEQKQSTVLSFYDKNLNCVGTKKLKYGLVGDTWRKPFCKDNHMYVNAAGLGGKKNLGISLDIDFNKRTINEFKHGLVGPADCVEADDYIFVCNNLNYKSNIVRCDKKSGNVIKFTDDISTLDTLYCYDKTLIAFGSDYRSSTKCYIYVMDFNLNLLKKIDISQLGYGVKNVELYEGKLLFGISNEQDDVNRIGVLSLEDYKVSCIELKECEPLDLQVMDNKLYVSDFSHGDNGKIEILDLNNNNSSILYFTHPVNCFYIDEECLYTVYGEDIYEYKLNDGKIKLRNKVKINTSKEKDVFYFVTGIFFKDIDL